MTQTNDLAHARKVIAAFVAMIVGRSVPVQWCNTAAMGADGSLMLPAPSVGDAAEIALLTRMAVHECGHLLETDAHVIDRLNDEQLAVFNCLEDPRVEARMNQRFAGAGLVLGRGLEEAMQAIAAKLDVTSDAGKAASLSLEILLRGTQAVAPQRAIERYAPEILAKTAVVVTEKQRDAIVQAVGEIAGMANSADCEAVAIRLVQQLHAAEHQQEQQPEQEAAGNQAQEENQGQPDDAQVEPDENAGSSDVTEGNAGADEEDGQPDGPQDTTQQDGSEGQEDDGGSQGSSGSDAGDKGGLPQGAGDTGNEEGSESTDSQQPQPGGGAGDAADTSSSGEAGASAGSEPGVEESCGDAGHPADGEAGGQPSANPAGQGGLNGEPTGEGPEGEPESAKEAAAPIPSEKFDMGDLLLNAYEAKFGLPDPEQYKDLELQEATASDMATMEAALAGLEAGDDVEDLLEAAHKSLTVAQSDAASPAAGSPGAHALKLVATSGTPLSLKLDGVQGRLVRVLLKEMQDKRRRPAKYAQAGGQIATNRFWRLARLGDTKVFKVRKLVNGIDAAATVLLDTSGSMESDLAMAAEVAVAFSLAMQRVGRVTTSVATFPHTSSATETLQRFGEPAQQAVRRVAALKADGGTPLGLAMATELPKLLQQQRERHFMFIVTDDGPDDPLLVQKVLALALENDVEVFGVGIGCDISAHIPRSVAVHDVNQLPDALEKLFKEQVALQRAA